MAPISADVSIGREANVLEAQASYKKGAGHENGTDSAHLGVSESLRNTGNLACQANGIIPGIPDLICRSDVRVWVAEPPRADFDQRTGGIVGYSMSCIVKVVFRHQNVYQNKHYVFQHVMHFSA